MGCTEGRRVGVRGALSMRPRCLDFICGHQGAAVLLEEGCSGQRTVSGQWGRRGWVDGRRRGGRPGGGKWEIGRGQGSGMTSYLAGRLDATWCWDSGAWICPLLFEAQRLA